MLSYWPMLLAPFLSFYGLVFQIHFLWVGIQGLLSLDLLVVKLSDIFLIHCNIIN